MKALAIIPAYNEEGSLAATIDELKRLAPEVDYLVVNDGSRDGTRALCIERGFNFLDLPVNVGLSAGFQAGMKYAVSHDYDCAVQFDADGQHRPEFLASMVEHMEQNGDDVVIGSRFVGRKKNVSARMAGSSLIKGMIRLTTGAQILDPTSGMRLYGRKAMAFFAQEDFFGPEPDTIAYLIRHGYKVAEVPVEMRDRTTGESYLSFTKSIKYMLSVCTSILFAQWFR